MSLTTLRFVGKPQDSSTLHRRPECHSWDGNASAALKTPRCDHGAPHSLVPASPLSAEVRPGEQLLQGAVPVRSPRCALHTCHPVVSSSCPRHACAPAEVGGVRAGVVMADGVP